MKIKYMPLQYRNVPAADRCHRRPEHLLACLVSLIHCTCGSWEGGNVTSSRSYLLAQSQETTAVSRIFGA